MASEFYTRRQTSREEFQNLSVPSTSTESMGAAFDLSFDDTGVGLVSRYVAVQEMRERNSRKLTPDEANALYPDMEVPFREEVTAQFADFLHSREQERKGLQKIIDNGPDQKILNFGAGLMAHLADPIEQAANLLGGWAIGGMAAKGAFGARAAALSKVVQSGGATFGQEAKLFLAEAGTSNLIENTIQEGFIAKQSAVENLDYDFGDSLTNVLVSTAAGTAFGAGVKGFSLFLKNRMLRNLRSTSPEADINTAGIAAAQMADGVRPNVAPLHTALAKETDVPASKIPGTQYTYTPYTVSSPRDFFMVSNSTKAGPEASYRDVGDSYFGGPQVTDSPVVANASATRAMADSNGILLRGDLNSVKILDLNKKIPKDVKSIFKPFFEAINEKEVEFKDITAKEAMDLVLVARDMEIINDADMANLRASLIKKGYGGILHDGSVRADAPHSQHNVVELFDRKDFKDKGYHTPTPGLTRTPTKPEIDAAVKYADDPANSMLVDMEDVEASNAKLAAEPEVKGDMNEVRARAEETLDELKTMRDEGLLDAHSERELAEVEKLEAEIEKQNVLAKAALVCVGR